MAASTVKHEEPLVIAGRYQLLERIGEGGMGIVWRGFDLDLEEPVALKLLRDELVNDLELRASFRREVKLARRVVHPNVARVYELGHYQGVLFLTMEFIPGETLLSLMNRGPVPFERAVRLARGLCAGLAAAHEAGVVHGDIKPNNILVSPGRGAVLTDFGIALSLSELHNGNGQSIGTPIYMAHEQFAGAPKSLQSDVYAVGVVLFELLTGACPWPTNDLFSLLTLKHGGREPDLRVLAPELSPAFIDLLTDCLRTDPQRRPAHARDLLERLTDITSDRPHTVPQTPPPLPVPLASGAGPMWIEVGPFKDSGQSGAAWVAGEVAGALSGLRNVRVMTPAREPGIPPERRTQVSGEVHKVAEGLRVTLAIVDGDRPGTKLEVFKPGEELQDLGAELASRIITSINPDLTPPELHRFPPLPPDALRLYLQARTAYMANSPQALPLSVEALALCPEHPALRLTHLMARVRSELVHQEPTRETLDRLLAEVEPALVEFSDLGEPYRVKGSILFLANQPVAAAMFTREALLRAPSLVPAYITICEQLIDIERLPDAARRLDIALALNQHNPYLWQALARLRAAEGRWDDFYALVGGKLTALRFRGPLLMRTLIGDPRRDVLERLAPALARNDDGLPPRPWQDTRDIVEFLLAREDRRAPFARLLAAHPGERRNAMSRAYAEILCDMACMLGDLDCAREQLRITDANATINWHWLARSPWLAPLRGELLFDEIRARVRARADAVADAIWG